MKNWFKEGEKEANEFTKPNKVQINCQWCDRHDNRMLLRCVSPNSGEQSLVCYSCIFSAMKAMENMK